MNFISIRNLHYGRVIPDPQWQMGPQRHLFHELIVVVRGVLQVTIGRQDIAARAGDVLFYPARTVHVERTDRADPLESIFFGWRGQRPDLPFRIHDTAGRIRILAGWLYDEKPLEYRHAAMVRLALFQALVAQASKCAVPQEPQLVVAIKKFIRGHLAEKLTLEQLAAQVNLSKYHFLRRYRELAGRTPMDEVRRLRLERARELVQATGLPLKQVADLVGFGDEYSLSKAFRAQLGCAPGKLRS